MLVFFLNLGFHYNAVEYRHKYFNTQRISMRKNPCFVVYTTASSEEPPSVMSGLRVSGSCVKSYQKFMCFSAHKIFTTFCAPFPNRISHFKILAMP